MFKALTDTTSLLGECPVWCERTERLFWTDIPGCELRALAPASGEVQRWSLPESLCSFALTADEDVLLMGLVDGKGAPDGSCIDAQGFLWNAEWGGSRVVRYAPDGKVDRVIESPCVQTTCPVFAGPRYETLYSTSARIGLVKPTDSDGTLMKAEAIVAVGLPEERFSGRLN
ncbi:SMP-30/gluconolactonase/LRE family protein [Pseudomonas sp. WP18]|uniref:SMP-30/gluconolactonase/LRE family protein n=1 Tax=Pseudomonas TaxID=286 RepID=UPI000F4A26F6|nr:SMP-30/gluconolactonase/LRE family protein [Pseudomonas brassicacearum]